jgi:hypothetical protein
MASLAAILLGNWYSSICVSKVAPGTAKGRIKTVFIQRLLECFGLHDVRVPLAGIGKGIYAFPDVFPVGMDYQFQVQFAYISVAELNHLAEFPGGVDVQEWKWDLPGKNAVQRQLQHYGGILADGIEHHRSLELCGYLADDVDAFRFKLFSMSQMICSHA